MKQSPSDYLEMRRKIKENANRRHEISAFSIEDLINNKWI